MIRPFHAVVVPAAALALVATLWFDSPPGDAIGCGGPSEVQDVVKREHVLTAEQLPRHYVGTFLWDGESAQYTQRLAMDLEEVNTQGSLIVATGQGTYTTTDRSIDFSVRVEVNQKTGEFKMWESNPSVATGFVTNGHHVAMVRGPFQELSARWIGDDGLRGNLNLQATGTSVRAKQQQAKRDCIQRKQRAHAAAIQREKLKQLELVQPAEQTKAVITLW